MVAINEINNSGIKIEYITGIFPVFPKEENKKFK